MCGSGFAGLRSECGTGSMRAAAARVAGTVTFFACVGKSTWGFVALDTAVKSVANGWWLLVAVVMLVLEMVSVVMESLLAMCEL